MKRKITPLQKIIKYQAAGKSTALSVEKSSLHFTPRDLAYIRESISAWLVYHPDCSLKLGKQSSLTWIELLGLVYKDESTKPTTWLLFPIITPISGATLELEYKILQTISIKSLEIILIKRIFADMTSE